MTSHPCSKLTIETLETTKNNKNDARRFGVFIVNFEHISLSSSVSIVNFEHKISSWDISENCIK